MGAVQFWTVTGPVCVEVGIRSQGDCPTLDEARQAFRTAFDKWLDWALNERRAVGWHE